MAERRRGAAAGLALMVVFGAVTLGFASVALAVVIVSPHRGAPALARAWARSVLALYGVRVELVGQVPPDRPLVVMANHTSHFDVLALYAGLPFPVRFVAKRELGYIPFFGWALALGVAVLIDRRDRGQAIAALDRAGALIRAGASVILFPEGTRTPDGVVGPLKKGPLHLAQAAAVPILPVGIRGSAAVLPKHGLVAQRGTITLHLGAPIATAGRAGDAARGPLLAEVRAALAALGACRTQDDVDTAALGS